jgi:NADH dehydrogenase [ubiquinone] 1 alpha subcomplex assembly factor 7
MNKLGAILKTRIEDDGPISVHDYMETALTHPEFGYYNRAEPFGVKGDFITAPETSQMFGELIGLWCVDAWSKLGAPNTFNLIELGPGNGTLMADALRSAQLVPEFGQAAKIHLVENSERLKTLQAAALSDYDVAWYADIPRFGDIPTLLVANEFFDALPIHQYIYSDDQWWKRFITCKEDQFEFTLDETPTNIPDAPAPVSSGDILETCPLAETYLTRIYEQLALHNGAALIIDYGAIETILGDSFQAVKGHSYTNPLSNPGESDLTAHVKFKKLEEIAKKHNLQIQGPTTQGRFLERLGIEARASMLGRKATSNQKQQILASLKRLTSAEEMGTLFKAFAVSHGMKDAPAGFGE